MEALIIDNHSKYISNIRRIARRLGTKSQVVSYDQLNPKLARKFDLFILSGGDINIRNNPRLRQERKLIKETKKPIFGICCGFEIISRLYGGKLIKLRKKKKGVKEITLVNGKSKKKKRKVFASHLYVIRNKPRGFQILGNSPQGIEIIRHRSRPILATQFHPEVTKGNEGYKVLEQFLKEFAGQKSKII